MFVCMKISLFVDRNELKNVLIYLKMYPKNRDCERILGSPTAWKRVHKQLHFLASVMNVTAMMREQRFDADLEFPSGA